MNVNNNISKKLREEIVRCTNHLKCKNGGIVAMDYYYNLANEWYGEMINYFKNAKEQGKLVVGTFCNFVPFELIHAFGGVPVRLCGGFGSTIGAAEKILPKVYCPLIKSTYGLVVEKSPYFDTVDVAICSTTCDGKKKLAELLAVHNIQTWVLELPHTINAPQSRLYWLANLKLLKKELEKLTGTRITTKKLKESIELYNYMRSLVHRLYDVRKRDEIPIWGRDALLVTNTGLYDDPYRWISATEKLCEELERKDEGSACSKDSPRLLLTGTPMIFPSWKLVNIIEDVGGIIVCDDICTGFKTFNYPVTPSHWTVNDMMIAIADKYLMNTCPCFVPNNARVDMLVQLVKDFRVEGVIYYMLQGCHLFGAENWRVKEALNALNVPLFSIETDYGDGDAGQIKVRMEAFVEMVRARRDETAFF